ncbi:DUF5789 family protein [Halalkalicoccus jeotgali]
MTQSNEKDSTREQGVEFGSLTDDLATCEYPVECTKLIDTYGEATLQLPNGTQSFQDVMHPSKTNASNRRKLSSRPLSGT